jgi:hypothetical protein
LGRPGYRGEHTVLCWALRGSERRKRLPSNPGHEFTGFLTQSRINLSVNGLTNLILNKSNKVNPRALFMLSLFLVLGAAGVSQAGPQTTPPVPSRQAAPAAPARQAAPTTVAGNPSKQAVSEPAPTKIIHIYRGEGYFDNALAEKLRPVLTGKPEPVPSHGSTAATDASRASLGSGDGSKRE